MLDKVKVAAAQVAPVFMDKEATIDKACKTIEEAGRVGAKLIVFSETFIPGYPYWRGLQPISKWSDYMVEYQKNSLKIPSSDTEILGDPTHGERMVWGMGDISDVRVFDTEIGTIGGVVCYEHHMTLLKAAMAALGEEIHCAVWPGWWVMKKHPGAKKRYRSGEDSPHFCDIEHAIREYAFETQTFVISVSQYIPDDLLPKDCSDFNIAAGGAFIVNPAGVYLQEPVFDKETIIYAELDADDRRHTKAYFDALGHYARWDVLRLELRGEPLEPLTTKTQFTLDPSMLKILAEKYCIELKKLEKILEELGIS